MAELHSPAISFHFIFNLVRYTEKVYIHSHYYLRITAEDSSLFRRKGGQDCLPPFLE
jgi:hypothetical protein